MSLAIAFAMTIIGLILVDSPESYILLRLEATLGLTFLLSIAIKLYTETHSSRLAKLSLYSLGAILMLGFFFLYSKNLVNTTYVEAQHPMQYVSWLFATITFIIAAPAIKKTYSEFDYWKYLTRLFGAVLSTAAYSIIIYGGLAIAFGAVSFLFSLGFKGELFARLWIIIVGLVSPTLFLNRAPAMTSIVKEEGIEYPKELRGLSYYVLVPLVSIYFAILYAYSLKIILTATWPEGIISIMILGFSGLGLFVYMTLYPLIKQTPVFAKTAKVFFVLLIPQIVMLFYAVMLRVNDYGVTEQRYMLIAGGVWLLYVSLYALLSKKKDLKIFFASLCVIVVLSSVGPWSMFSVSVHSQKARLEALLLKNNLLLNNQMQRVLDPKTVSVDDQKEISGIIQYLSTTHTLDVLHPWTPQSIKPHDESAVMDLLGIQMVDTYSSIDSDGQLNLSIRDWSQTLVVDTQGYDHYIYNLISTVVIDGANYQFSYNDSVYEVHQNGVLIAYIPLQNFIQGLLSKAKTAHDVVLSQEDMTYMFENVSIKLKILLTGIQGAKDHPYLNGSLLIKVE
ncbi:MAG: hypothetical protein RJB39_356 [Candidatus Parcubacteria bacterium]